MHMRVSEVMAVDILCVPPGLSWKEAARLFLEARVSAAPVVDASGSLVGILSEKDLFRGLFPRYVEWMAAPHAFHDFEAMERPDVADRDVSELMARRLITASPETPVLKVGALMAASGIHHVPVVDGTKVIGMVNRGSIYRAILQKYFL